MNIIAQLEDEEQVFGINHGTGPGMSPRMQRHFMGFVREHGLSAYLAMRRDDPEQIAQNARTRAALDAALASIDAKFSAKEKNMKPICTDCQRFYRPKENGVYFIEGMPTDNAAPGTAEPEKWKPYKLWSGDLWECKGCNNTIIVGVGRSPISEHFQPDFPKAVTSFGARLQINDC